MDEKETNIVPSETQTPEVELKPVDLTGGVEDGTIEKDREDLDELKRNGIQSREKIVHEFDDKGNVTGFHKESVTQGE